MFLSNEQSALPKSAALRLPKDQVCIVAQGWVVDERGEFEKDTDAVVHVKAGSVRVEEDAKLVVDKPVDGAEPIQERVRIADVAGVQAVDRFCRILIFVADFTRNAHLL